jgi:long-chain acyl-CoA synthetase
MRNRAHALLEQARARGDRVALVSGHRCWTFAQWRDEALRFAAGLQAAGFRRGSILGLMLSSRPEFLFLEYAAFVLGGAVVPINVHYKRQEIEHVLVACDVDVLVTEAALVERLAHDVRSRCPSLRQVFVFDPAGRSPAALRGDADGVVPVEVEGDDLALLLCTSATTGRAKGVMLTVANLEANYDPTPGWVGVGADDVILGALPLYNTFALNHCINAPPVTGATLVLLPRFDEVACLDAIARHRCTYFPAVPTMLQKVLDHPDAAGVDLSSFRRTLVGGAPVPAALLATAHARVGTHITVFTGYGLTEATALVTMQHVTLDATGALAHEKTIGRCVPGVEMAILDDAGDPVATGVVGEICVRGPLVMKGYYKMPEETARTIVEGWLHTGDLGRVDADGFFYIVDRKKDLVIRGGQNVYPAEIEAVLYGHPAVAEAAVVGRADEVLGEVPTAFVALKPSAVATADALLVFCRERLASFKVPVALEILDELPKGVTGKILRRALKQASP